MPTGGGGGGKGKKFFKKKKGPFFLKIKIKKKL